MVFAAVKGLVFSKYWCFRELVRRYPSIFLIMLSPTMNINGLDFFGLVGFWYVVVVYLFLYQGVDYPYMARLIYIWGFNFSIGQMHCFIWMCLNNTINLSIFHSAIFLCQFCKLMIIVWLDGISSNGYISIATFFIFFKNFVEFWTFTRTAIFGFTGVVFDQCSNDIVFFYFLS